MKCTADDILGAVMIVIALVGLSFVGGYFTAEEQSHEIYQTKIAAADARCNACMTEVEYKEYICAKWSDDRCDEWVEGE